MGDVVKLDPRRMPLRLRVVEAADPLRQQPEMVSDNLRPVVPPARPWVLPSFDEPKEPA